MHAVQDDALTKWQLSFLLSCSGRNRGLNNYCQCHCRYQTPPI